MEWRLYKMHKTGAQMMHFTRAQMACYTFYGEKLCKRRAAIPGGCFISCEVIEVLTLVIAHQRGHEIYWDGSIWRYTDNGHLFDDRRSCIKCGRMPTPDGYDACLGYIKGATSACCGHGVEEPYAIRE